MLEYESVTGPDVSGLIDELARLRGTVFRDFPYLYEADAEYEATYLAGYAQEEAIVVTARSRGRLVGAATGMPLLNHVDNLSTALSERFETLEDVFYCAESVLLSEFRGQGAGHRFFDLREAHARRLGACYSVFCAVDRPDDHPEKPAGYRPLTGFWTARGYEPLGVTARLSWPDIGEAEVTEKPMIFWGRSL